MNDFLILLLLLAIFVIIISYLIYNYVDLNSNIKKIFYFQTQIEECFNRRFKIFEDIIQKSNISYDNTIIKEIVQLRSYSQTLKAYNDTEKYFETEGKITKIASLVFQNYSEFQTLNEFKELERQNYLILGNIDNLKEEYNQYVIEYNKRKFSFLGSLICQIFNKKFHYDFPQLKDISVIENIKI